MTEEAVTYDVETETEFDPAKYLSSVGGKAYLEVKWRVVWIDHDAKLKDYAVRIDTDLLSHTDKNAIFKARVTIVDSNGVLVRETSGHGSEDKDDFRDFLEKAETKAIGRALAAAGYGSQFATDFYFGAAHERVGDGPVR